MKTLLKIYNDAPPIGKILLIAAGILLAYFIYVAIKKVLAVKPPNQSTIDSSKNELQELAKIGEVTNYTPTQLNSFADKLFKAMDGVGTDEEQIAAVFNYMQNKADVLELIKAFGVRNYEDRTFSDYNYNLTEWLNEELSEEDLQEYVNGPLKQKRIDYKF